MKVITEHGMGHNPEEILIDILGFQGRETHPERKAHGQEGIEESGQPHPVVPV